MLDFLKERIALFVLLLAGDSVSLLAFIKATELRGDALTLAIVLSLPPSLIISLLIKYLFVPRSSKKTFIIIAASLATLCWLGVIFSYMKFSKVNNNYGKVAYPKNRSLVNPVDSIIVGGCHYTPEAQAEVDDFKKNNKTLTTGQLFADFNYDVHIIWIQQEIDCARGKILNSFAIMIVFLMAGITLTCELLIAAKNSTPT
jgi:hypothetical protein